MQIINRIFAALVGLVVLCSVAQANYVGIPPIPGGDAALIDQNWLLGVVGGQNQTKLFGITAHAGGGQSGAFLLLPGIALFQVDTVVTGGDSVALPACKAPFQLLVRNNGVNALQMYTYPRSADTINQIAGSTGISLAANTVTLFACIRDTQWSTVSGGGGGGGGGTGTVTSVTGGCGLGNTSPNPISTVGTLNATVANSNMVSTSPYTFQTTDACSVIVLNPGSGSLTLPAASTPGFGAGNFWYVDNQSATTVTINVVTPSNLDGSSSQSFVNQTAFSFQSDGNNYHFTSRSAPGIGTVTNVSGTCGISVSNPTASAVVTSNLTPVIVTGNNAPIVTGYCGQAIFLNNASNQIPTIAQAGSAGFALGWQTLVCNIGGGTQTLTPSAGTIGGLASFLLAAATPSAPTCVGIISDGVSNYDIVNGSAGTVSSVSASCGNTTGTGAITSAGTVTGLVTPTVLTGSPPITSNYCGGIEYLNNAALATPTIAEAGTTGFAVGWFTDLCNENSGALTVSVATPGTIGGASTRTIASGSAATPTCIRIISDGVSNYYVR